MILNKLSKNNKGSGIAIVIYGVVLMLVFIFTTINILNAKIIENSYNSLRDAVLAASSGSVIHLLTSQTGSTTQQDSIIRSDDNPENKYDVYLQLALGYIINRKTGNSQSEDSKTIGVATNNFIKLDHKKVVNSTMALLNDATLRNRNVNVGDDIGDTERFKVLMFFIEPYYDANYEKYFNIIMYHNGMYDRANTAEWTLDTNQGEATIARGGSMTEMYNNIQWCINDFVNNTPVMKLENNYKFEINLNPNGGKLDDLVREMETVPYYLIVVKDFALPTLFNDTETNTKDKSIFKSVFTSLSGDGSLKTPMCALNSGKTERKLKEDI